MTDSYSTRLVKYSIVRGGLFYRLQERLRLLDKNDSRLVERALLFALIAWFPLALLANFQGLAVNDNPHKSLLLDFPVYSRFLIALPIFVFAENLIEDRYVIIASYFLNSGIVPKDERSAYMSILASSQRLVLSPVVEVVLFVMAYGVAVYSVFLDSAKPSWEYTSDSNLSWAGGWYVVISLPLFHFLLLRWVWRFLIWACLQWRAAHLNLRLLSTHPDAAGGLGILSESINAFAPILFAISAVLSAVWCKRVIYDGVSVTEFHRPFLVFLVGALFVSIVPLLLFTFRLIRVKLRGLHDYGVLANHHSLLFERKWVQSAGTVNKESLLGTPDISSLCDLTTDYNTVQSMKFVPFRLQSLIFLAVAVAIPMIPLVLIEIPLRDLIVKIGAALI